MSRIMFLNMFDGFLIKFVNVIMRAVYGLYFGVIKAIAWVLDMLTQLFFIFSGMTPVGAPNAESSTGEMEGIDIVNFFLTQKAFQKGYLALCGVALALIVVFTIAKIIKQDYFERSGPRSKGPIFRNVALSFIAFICIIPVFYFLIEMAGSLALLVMKALGYEGGGIGTLLFNLSWEDGGKSVRALAENIPADGGKFNFIVDGTTFELDLGETNYATSQVVGSMDKKNNFGWYSIDTFYAYFWNPIQGVKNIEAGVDSSAHMVEFYWYIFIFAGGALLANLIQMLLAMITRLYNLIALFVVAPAPISQIVLDEGAKFKAWKDHVVQEALKVVGNVMSFMIFIMIAGAIKDLDLMRFAYTEFSASAKNIIDSNSMVEQLGNDVQMLYYGGDVKTKFDSAINSLGIAMILVAGAGAIKDIDAVVTKYISGGSSSMELGNAGKTLQGAGEAAMGVVKGAASLVGNVAGKALGSTVKGIRSLKANGAEKKAEKDQKFLDKVQKQQDESAKDEKANNVKPKNENDDAAQDQDANNVNTPTDETPDNENDDAAQDQNTDNVDDIPENEDNNDSSSDGGENDDAAQNQDANNVNTPTNEENNNTATDSGNKGDTEKAKGIDTSKLKGKDKRKVKHILNRQQKAEKKKARKEKHKDGIIKNVAKDILGGGTVGLLKVAGKGLADLTKAMGYGDVVGLAVDVNKEFADGYKGKLGDDLDGEKAKLSRLATKAGVDTHGTEFPKKQKANRKNKKDKTNKPDDSANVPESSTPMEVPAAGDDIGVELREPSEREVANALGTYGSEMVDAINSGSTRSVDVAYANITQAAEGISDEMDLTTKRINNTSKVMGKNSPKIAEKMSETSAQLRGDKGRRDLKRDHRRLKQKEESLDQKAVAQIAGVQAARAEVDGIGARMSAADQKAVAAEKTYASAVEDEKNTRIKLSNLMDEHRAAKKEAPDISLSEAQSDYAASSAALDLAKARSGRKESVSGGLSQLRESFSEKWGKTGTKSDNYGFVDGHSSLSESMQDGWVSEDGKTRMSMVDQMAAGDAIMALSKKADAGKKQQLYDAFTYVNTGDEKYKASYDSLKSEIEGHKMYGDSRKASLSSGRSKVNKHVNNYLDRAASYSADMEKHVGDGLTAAQAAHDESTKRLATVQRREDLGAEVNKTSQKLESAVETRKQAAIDSVAARKEQTQVHEECDGKYAAAQEKLKVAQEQHSGTVKELNKVRSERESIEDTIASDTSIRSQFEDAYDEYRAAQGSGDQQRIKVAEKNFKKVAKKFNQQLKKAYTSSKGGLNAGRAKSKKLNSQFARRSAKARGQRRGLWENRRKINGMMDELDASGLREAALAEGVDVSVMDYFEDSATDMASFQLGDPNANISNKDVRAMANSKKKIVKGMEKNTARAKKRNDTLEKVGLKSSRNVTIDSEVDVPDGEPTGGGAPKGVTLTGEKVVKATVNTKGKKTGGGKPTVKTGDSVRIQDQRKVRVEISRGNVDPKLVEAYKALEKHQGKSSDKLKTVVNAAIPEKIEVMDDAELQAEINKLNTTPYDKEITGVRDINTYRTNLSERYKARAEEYKTAVSNLKDKMSLFNRTGDVASLEAARKAIAEVINANVSFKKVESEIKKGE